MTGQGAGDDEQIQVDLSKIPSTITKLVIAVAIYKWSERRQNFGQVDNSYVRILEGHAASKTTQTGVIFKYALQEDYGTATAMIFGELVKSNSIWKFRAVGQGYTGGFEKLKDKFGPPSTPNEALDKVSCLLHIPTNF